MVLVHSMSRFFSRAVPQRDYIHKLRKVDVDLVSMTQEFNLAFREGRVPSDNVWRRVQPFHDVDAPVGSVPHR